MSLDDAYRPYCQIWGVLNVTPDSFSDGGRYLDVEAAVRHACDMYADGAMVIDVGGASTRPRGGTYGAGAAPVDETEELRRVVPVIRQLVDGKFGSVSIDTTKPRVAEQALQAGAGIVNDVSCASDPRLLAVVAEARAEFVIMHTRGRGEVTGSAILYEDVVRDVRDELLRAVERAVDAGIEADRIWIDPGLGFAKTWRQSLRLLAHMRALVETGLRVLVGASRKSFLAEAAPDAAGRKPAPEGREAGSAAAVASAVEMGVAAVRVHDVKAAYQVVQLVERLGLERSVGVA